MNKIIWCSVCGTQDSTRYTRCMHPGCTDGRDKPITVPMEPRELVSAGVRGPVDYDMAVDSDALIRAKRREAAMKSRWLLIGAVVFAVAFGIGVAAHRGQVVVEQLMERGQ